MLQQVMIVAIGGAIGAALRFALGQWIDSAEFPWSTFIVNISGSFLLGLLSIYAINSGLSNDLMLFFGTGMLGAFTTMSTFSVETLGLIKEGNQNLALIYACITFILCLIGAFIGWELGQIMEKS